MITFLRHIVRSLWQTRNLSLAAVACIALGTGATVFIVTIADGILLRRPPFPEADRLVRLWTLQRETGRAADVSYLEARDVAQQAASFETLEIAARTRIALTTVSGTERVRGESVTPGYFGLLGLQPAQGRAFAASEYLPDADRVMIISHTFWQRKFGGRSDILGRTVRARGSMGMDAEQVFTIVGVMPERFSGTVDTDISEFWLPIEQYIPRMILDERQARSAWVLARLRSGVQIAQAQSEIAEIGKRLTLQYPAAYQNLELALEPFGESWRERFRGGLQLLIGAAALLLLIACTNVAHLLLARLAQKESEIRVRYVLGAGRARIVTQLLGESLILAVAGGVIGTLAAIWAIQFFIAMGIFRLPDYLSIGADGRVIAVAGGLVLLTTLSFGGLPTWLGARMQRNPQLRESGRTSIGVRQRRIIDGLAAAEIACSLLLLVGALLLVRTYGNLVRSDLGFRTERLLRMAISLDPAAYPDAAGQNRFVNEARVLLSSQPGVAEVSFMAGVLPPWFDQDVRLAQNGRPHPALSRIQRHAIDASFMSVMDIPLRSGRAFTAEDRTDTRPVAIVSEALARTLAGGDGSTALGMTIQTVRESRTNVLSEPLEIVGIAGNVRYHGPLSDRSIDYDLYVPIEQAPDHVLSIAILTHGDPLVMMEPLQRALGQLAPSSPQHWISTMQDELRLQYTDARLYAWLTGVFGGSALLLVVLGLYGVLSNAVNRRMREWGIRMAIGANHFDIISLVMAQAARPLTLGLIVGLVAAAATARLVRGLLYGVAPTDPVTFLSVTLLLVAVSVLASLLPAVRALRLSPNTVLRNG